MATEKRLIEANETINAFTNWLTSRYDGRLPRDIVAEIPTVDAVEVVRCKDCKHYDNSEGIQWCKLNSKFYPGGFDWHSFPEDGFCYYGERRTDER